MFCPMCGVANPDGAKFCLQCGAQIITEPSIRLKRSKTKFIILGTACFTIIVSILLCVLLIPNKSSDTCFSNHRTQAGILTIDGTNKYTIFTGKGDAIVSELSDIEQVDHNLDQSVVAVLDDEGTLYLADETKMTEVGSHVLSFRLSDNGTGIAYVTREDNNIQTLQLYDVKKQSSIKIDENVTEYCYCISPNGNSVAYIKDSYSSEDFVSYMCINGKDIKEIGHTKYPKAIADDGKYLYFTEGGNFYVKKKDGQQKLSSDSVESIILNYDYSQIIYSKNGNGYYSMDGNAPQKIWSESIYGMITSDQMAKRYHYYEIDSMVYGVAELTNRVYMVSDGIMYLDSKSTGKKIHSSSYDSFHLSENGEELLISKHGNLYKISKMNQDDYQVDVLAKDININVFYAAKDNSYLYFINEENELMFLKEKGVPKKIADDVDKFTITTDVFDQTIYFLVDVDDNGYGQLYYSKDGKSKKVVKGADEVQLNTIAGKVYCITKEESDKYTLFVLNDGKATELLSNITEWYE